MSQYIEFKRFRRILLLVLGILLFPFVIGFLGNLVYGVWLNMQQEPSPEKDRLTIYR